MTNSPSICVYLISYKNYRPPFNKSCNVKNNVRVVQSLSNTYLVLGINTFIAVYNNDFRDVVLEYRFLERNSQVSLYFIDPLKFANTLLINHVT